MVSPLHSRNSPLFSRIDLGVGNNFLNTTEIETIKLSSITLNFRVCVHLKHHVADTMSTPKYQCICLYFPANIALDRGCMI